MGIAEPCPRYPPPHAVWGLRQSILTQAEELALPTDFGGRGLTGYGVRIGVWDGTPYPHPDFKERLNIVERLDKSKRARAHGTHVIGILAGAGYLNPRAKGIAPGVKVWAYNLDRQQRDTFEFVKMYRARDKFAITLTNNSYSPSFDARCSNYRKVRYGVLAQGVDRLCCEEPRLTHVYSVGQERWRRACNRKFIKGFRSATIRAKNPISVGAVDRLGRPVEGASWGPTDDGRLVPTVVANGERVLSTISKDAYGVLDGTSMACPTVTGILALATERWKQLYTDHAPPNYLLKGFLANTADDVGTPGPDYQTGYGQVNALHLVNALENGYFLIDSLAAGDSQKHHQIPIPEGISALRVMLVWNDPPSRNTLSWGDKTLVHDLDLILTKDSENFYPLVLDPVHPDRPATMGRDTRNNIEQVRLENPDSGMARIQVEGHRLGAKGQSYALTWWYEKPQSTRFLYPLPGLACNGEEPVPFALNQLPELSQMAISTPGEKERLLGYVDGPHGQFHLLEKGIFSAFFRLIPPDGHEVISSPFMLSSPVEQLVIEPTEGEFTLSWKALTHPSVASYTVWRTSPYTPRWDSVATTTHSAIRLHEDALYGGITLFCITSNDSRGHHGVRSRAVRIATGVRHRALTLRFAEEDEQGYLRIRANRRRIAPSARVARGTKLSIAAEPKRGWRVVGVYANGRSIRVQEAGARSLADFHLPDEGALTHCDIRVAYARDASRAFVPFRIRVHPDSATCTLRQHGKAIRPPAYVARGETFVLRVVPKPHCALRRVLVNGVPANVTKRKAEYTLTISGPTDPASSALEVIVQMQQPPTLPLLVGDTQGQGTIRVTQGGAVVLSGERVACDLPLFISVVGAEPFAPTRLLLNGRVVARGDGLGDLIHVLRIAQAERVEHIFLSADFKQLTPTESSVQPSASRVRIYPNPFHSYVRIDSELPARSLRLYSALGRLVFSLPRGQYAPSELRGLSLLAPGVYLLQCELESGEVLWERLLKTS